MGEGLHGITSPLKLKLWADTGTSLIWFLIVLYVLLQLNEIFWLGLEGLPFLKKSQNFVCFFCSMEIWIILIWRKYFKLLWKYNSRKDRKLFMKIFQSHLLNIFSCQNKFFMKQKEKENLLSCEYFFMKSTLHPVAYLGFRKGGAKFLLATSVHTKEGANQVFQFFLM